MFVSSQEVIFDTNMFCCIEDLIDSIEEDSDSNGLCLTMPDKNIVNNCRLNFESYCIFASHFIAPVVGKHRYNNLCWRSTFLTYVSKSDEAFALLTFENNYDQWIGMANSNDWGSSSIKPAYTNGGNNLQTPKPPTGQMMFSKTDNPALISSGQSSRSSSVRCQGWSAHGIKRFNELFDLVEKERESSIGLHFEEEYMKQCMNAREQGKKKSHRNNAVYKVCRHELWSSPTSKITNVHEEDELAPDTNPSGPFVYESSLDEDDDGQDDDASVGFSGFMFEA